MQLKSRFWSDLTTRDFMALAQRDDMGEAVAVLPVAAVEQHGPHLPLSVDADLNVGIVQACLPHLAADLGVLFLPAQNVGKSNEHAAFPGTLTLSSTTVLALWTEIGACVARAGLKKLVLFNTHGGHTAVMDLVARDLRERHGLMVWSCSWFNLPLDPTAMAPFDAEEQRFGIHAGDIETSMMLALRPHWVDMTEAQHFPSQSQARAATSPLLGNGRSAKLGWQMQDYNPDGAVGHAERATAAKGQALIASAGEQLAVLLGEVARLPLSASPAR